MITTIKKRDGRIATFNLEKISEAIFKAARAVGGNDYEMAQNVAGIVYEKLNEKYSTENIPTVEQVQDLVEKVLQETHHSATAKQYILYRAERSRIREMNTSLMKLYEDLTFKDAKDSDVLRENANIDGDTAMGTMLKYGSEGAKQFNKLFILDPNYTKAHEEGDIHIHDLDFLTLTATCCQIDLVKLFKDGFCTGHGFLREPNDIASYSALAAIAIQSNQNDQHGGQSVFNFEYAMALGVAKTYKKIYYKNLAKVLDIEGIENSDELVETLKAYMYDKNLIPKLLNCVDYQKAEADWLRTNNVDEKIIKYTQEKTEIYTNKETDRATFQAMEALVHNLNTMHSRAGAQIPFSSINYGLDVSHEGRLVIKNILLATEKGLGNGETAIFPIHIFKVKEGINFNPGEPNYDLFKLAIKVSAERLFPNFSFIDAPFNLQYYKEGDYNSEVAYMGCRTRVVGNYYDKSREIVSGRGNLSFTSVNLPRLAILSKGDKELFFKKLGEMLELCSRQLMDRYKIIARKKVKNFPFLMGQGVWIDSDKLSSEDEIGEVLKHGTLTVGFIGLAECLKALIGCHHGETADAQKLGLDIIGYMRKYMDDKTVETGFNYTLIATPAEGLSGRFVNIDKKVFGVLPGITDREYYTNSFHIPVYYPISAIKKIKLEAPYHALTNAGHISYIELDGDPVKNLDAFEKLVRCMKESGVGYGSINHPLDRDPVCGYSGVIDNVCPGCGRKETDGESKFERIRRITGYLVGTVERFNNAKRKEVEERLKHNVKDKN